MKVVYRPSRSGKTYEDCYSGWISFFRDLASSRERLSLAVPACWKPLCEWLGHEVVETLEWFPEDRFLRRDLPVTRRLVEVASACRPELVHALYLCDTEWKAGPEYRDRKFPVTCNASFFRREVLEYLQRLRQWEPPEGAWSGRIIVICPCAADKPYPAPLHRRIAEAVPNAYLIVATGVLGLVPEHLWGEAPDYDAGLPNQLRVMEETEAFFLRNGGRLEAPVLVYSDFNTKWICRGLKRAGTAFVSVLPEDGECPEYLDMAGEEMIRKLIGKVLDEYERIPSFRRS